MSGAASPDPARIDLSRIGAHLTGRLALAATPLEKLLVALLEGGQRLTLPELVAGAGVIKHKLGLVAQHRHEHVLAALRSLRRKGYQLRCGADGAWRLWAKPVLVLEQIGPAGEPPPKTELAAAITAELVAPKVIAMVCAAAGITPAALKGSGRRRCLSRARWLVAETLTERGLSTTQIGQLLGDKDHTSVMHGLRQMRLLRGIGLDNAAILRGEGPRRLERVRPYPRRGAATEQAGNEVRAG